VVVILPPIGQLRSFFLRSPYTGAIFLGSQEARHPDPAMFLVNQTFRAPSVFRPTSTIPDTLHSTGTRIFARKGTIGSNYVQFSQPVPDDFFTPSLLDVPQPRPSFVIPLLS